MHKTQSNMLLVLRYQILDIAQQHIQPKNQGKKTQRRRRGRGGLETIWKYGVKNTGVFIK